MGKWIALLLVLGVGVLLVAVAVLPGGRSPLRRAEREARRQAKSLPAPAGTPGGGKKDISGDDVHKAAEIFHDVTRTVDDVADQVIGLSPEEERQVGADGHADVAKQYRTETSGPRQALIERLGRKVEPFAKRPLKYTYTIIVDKVVNAFSQPGGYVYANTGLLDFMRGDAEVQFVMAHEIAHIELRHCAKQMNYYARASQVAGALAGQLVRMAHAIIAVGYSQEQEFEADRWAYRAMRKLGWSHDDCTASLRRMRDKLPGNQQGGQRPNPDDVFAATVHELDNHFRTHPPLSDRVKRLDALRNEAN